MKQSNRISGFTTVEVIVAIVLVVALLLPTSVVSVYFMGSIFNNFSRASMENSVASAMGSIGDEFRSASAVVTSTTADLNKPGGWTTSGTAGVLVLSTPSLKSDQSVIINSSTNEPYLDEIVYYVSESKLMKRTLVSGASNNVRKSTCPDSKVTTACPADATLADHVSLFGFTMHDLNGNEITNANDVQSINISMTLTKPSFRSSIELSKDMRITRRS